MSITVSDQSNLIMGPNTTYIDVTEVSASVVFRSCILNSLVVTN